jgi:hypothetical protein
MSGITELPALKEFAEAAVAIASRPFFGSLGFFSPVAV